MIKNLKRTGKGSIKMKEMQNKLAKQFTVWSLLRFALPTIVMMLFMSFYTMIDGIFVSNILGTDALSAVNLVYPAISVVVALGVMLATGGSAVIAKKMGEGEPAEARQDFTLIVSVGVFIGLLLTLVSSLFLLQMLRFLGASGEIYALCYAYARPYIWFIPSAVLQMLFQTFFVTAGRPAVGLTVTVLGGIANIVLDYVFIGVFGWGMAGAAVATGIGYSVPALFGLAWFAVSRRGTLYFVRPVLRGKVLLKALGNGSSEMVTYLSEAVVTFLFNMTMLRYLGADGVAAITIVLYTDALLVGMYLGYGIGVAPVLSYNYGQRDRAQLVRLFKISLWFLGVCSLVTLAGGLLFTRQLVGVFASDGTAVFDLAVFGFSIYSICFLFKGTNIFASALFTALSDGKTSAILSFLRTFVFIAAGILLLPLWLGVNGVWLAVPFAETVSIFLSVYCFRTNFFSRIRSLETNRE